MDRVLEDMPAEGKDCGTTVEAPETSTLREKVFPEASLTILLLESVAQTEMNPRIFVLKPSAAEGFFSVATTTCKDMLRLW
jgi:hypothetical protein